MIINEMRLGHIAKGKCILIVRAEIVQIQSEENAGEIPNNVTLHK